MSGAAEPEPDEPTPGTPAPDPDAGTPDPDAGTPDPDPDAPGAPESGLSEQDLAVLALERRGWPPAAGTKERVIREGLQISPTRYYQLLNALLDDPAALAHDPVTVNRLRRVRDERRSRR